MSQENYLPQNETFLIAGLGNPGREYQNNRHNAGFLFANALAQRLDVSFSRVEMKALVTKARYNTRQIIIAKPQTFMNRSGQAVASLAKYYKVPSHAVLVAFDDVDLPFGTLRMRPFGGSGGHNGMKSIIQSLGTEEFPRLRIGVNRPPGRLEAADYVLQDFSAAESAELPAILERGVQAALLFFSQGLDFAMTTCNTEK